MLANRLKILLAERDLSIKDLMEATGLSRNSLSNMVNNPFANIATDNVDKLCNFLEVAPSKFYDYLPWHFSIGCSLRERKLKYRYMEKFMVGYFLVSATSGHRKLETGFEIYLESSAPDKKQPILILTIQNPRRETFDNLYQEMSPLFRHTLQEKIITLMKDFFFALSKAYDFTEIYKKSGKIKVYIDMYGTPSDNFEANEFFSSSFEYKLQDLMNQELVSQAVERVEKGQIN